MAAAEPAAAVPSAASACVRLVVNATNTPTPSAAATMPPLEEVR